MEKISLDILQKEINLSLEKQAISGRYLLDRFCVIDESSRKSPPYLDPRYAPFYYYLGKYLRPIKMIEIGFDLGLLSSSFLLSCKTVEHFFGFKETVKEKFFSNRIGTTNLKKVYKKERFFYEGEIFDNEFEKNLRSKKWDIALINEEKEYDKQLQYMETLWKNVNKNGVLVVEYIKSHKHSKEAFKSFVENKNLPYLEFQTRYGTGVIVNEV